MCLPKAPSPASKTLSAAPVQTEAVEAAVDVRGRACANPRAPGSSCAPTTDPRAARLRPLFEACATCRVRTRGAELPTTLGSTQRKMKYPKCTFKVERPSRTCSVKTTQHPVNQIRSMNSNHHRQAQLEKIHVRVVHLKHPRPHAGLWRRVTELRAARTSAWLSFV